jgi:tRNA uridine 5-carboxymethylaminomethyl modification enzyme
VGLLPERNYTKFKAKQKSINTELVRLQHTRVGTELLEQMLRRPEISYKDLPNRDDGLSAEVIQQVEIAIKYAGYIDRQQSEIEKFKSMEGKQIPESFDYSTVPSLRSEARQKLTKLRPATLGQASRISGVSPADISILTVWLKRSGNASANCGESTPAQPVG